MYKLVKGHEQPWRYLVTPTVPGLFGAVICHVTKSFSLAMWCLVLGAVVGGYRW